ncbi:MAG: efflux RND transporter periplasmic adaptor subunit [Isosphaeraceae bacterium]|nr:efflux RND transporter periplasmic adaptor subunit [Isosphaeraceae bacterium]
MKKAVIGIAIVVAIVAIGGVSVALLRPELVPAWARIQTVQAEDYGPYCKEHEVPEKFCTLCHPELKEKLLLCTEHGNIPEDICTLCHPEAQQKYDIEMCPKGHGLPKHFCYKCELESGKEPTASSNLVNDGWCATFGETPAPGKPKVSKLLPLVRFASAGLAGEIGLATASICEEEHVHELSAPAETAYDANRYAEITPRVRGFLREARFDLGQTVKAGEVLAVVDSAEVSTAKTEYIAGRAALSLAEDTYRRVESLMASAAIAAKERPAALSAVNQARASMLSAEQRLRNFRFADEDLARILKINDTTPILEIVTPIEGTIVFRHAVIGEAVEPTMKLYTVADTSKLWLWIDVFERDISQVKPGQTVTFTVLGTASASEEATYTGKITWVGTEVDEKTRTTKVRAEIPNPEGHLRASQFGRARIQLGEPHKALIVPKEAVQRYESVDLVFLKQRDGVYRPQRIKTKPLGRGETLEVTWGLQPGQEVVTAGSFLLKTEIMKGSIGAGCCD